jgi:hypothetical protein
MKAVQLWALLKYLPLAIGDVVPADNAHWLFLLHLPELVDLLFAPVFTTGMVDCLKEFISDHLQMFLELYGIGDNCIKLKPKHHLLLHMPSVILASGPLLGMNCLRYELKNSFFKRTSHIMCNFTNICKTLAFRHQQHSLFCKLSHMHVRESVIVSCSSCDLVVNFACADVLCSFFGLEQTDDICVSHRADTASVQYAVGHHVIVDMAEEPNFGKIEFFVSVPKSNNWFIVVSCLRTLGYYAHYHSFSVEHKNHIASKLFSLMSWWTFTQSAVATDLLMASGFCFFVCHIMYFAFSLTHISTLMYAWEGNYINCMQKFFLCFIFWFSAL